MRGVGHGDVGMICTDSDYTDAAYKRPVLVGRYCRPGADYDKHVYQEMLDNQGATMLVKNRQNAARCKLIDVRHHFLRNVE